MAVFNIKISNISPATVSVGGFTIPSQSSITTSVDPVNDTIWIDLYKALALNTVSVVINSIQILPNSNSIYVNSTPGTFPAETRWPIGG